MTSTSRLRRFLTGPFSVTTWRAHGYLWLMLILGPFAFAHALLVPVLTSGLAVTLVGLFVPGWLVVAARGWGAAHRGLASHLLGVDVPPPTPHRHQRGFWATMGGNLGDGAGWRTILFMVLAFVLSLVAFPVSIAFLAVGFGGVTYWYWYRFLPLQEGLDGAMHRGASFGPGHFLDTPERLLLAALIGLFFLFVLWPWMTRGFTALYGMMVSGLLGPTRASVRVARAEAARRGTVEDAEVRLRRLERDLHDGVQARLTSLGMQVGEARMLHDAREDPEIVSSLLKDAQANVSGTIVDLRELTRGVRPPILDSGLEPALRTLVARSGLDVELEIVRDTVPLPGVGRTLVGGALVHGPAGGSRLGESLAGVRESVRSRLPGGESVIEPVRLDTLPAPVVTIAYFTVAELLTNVSRHAGVDSARVVVDLRHHGRHDAVLVLDVEDAGRGGAHVPDPDPVRTGGTGLDGLRRRLRGVDGHLEIDSPVGGPTRIRAEIPAGE
ncbi:sensor histidine kinase [Brevibacterium litoralis]|uniref:sensor histidine kinase n=1 Tax=Brevibacterium litoralis TaxID=3138935 RepID=UPI0032EDEF17